jgi:hypothetical protein
MTDYMVRECGLVKTGDTTPLSKVRAALTQMFQDGTHHIETDADHEDRWRYNPEFTYIDITDDGSLSSAVQKLCLEYGQNTVMVEVAKFSDG